MTTDNEIPAPTDKSAEKREQNAKYRRRAKERREADPELREAWLQRKREEATRYAARKKQKEQCRRREVERVRAWVDENPERAAETKRRWTERNRDKVRASQLAYYYRNRDARLEALRDRNASRRADPAQREKQRQYRAANRERLNAQQRERRSTPEGRQKHLIDERERRQRERRRRELGLPPRPRHRSTTNERARNMAAADEFFSRRRTKRELRKLDAELRDVRAQQAAAEVIATDEARKATSAVVRDEYDSEQELFRFLNSSASAGLREEVRMDSIARQLRGLRPYADLDLEVQGRAGLLVSAGRRRGESHTARRPVAHRAGSTAPAPLPVGDHRTSTGHHPRVIEPAGRSL